MTSCHAWLLGGAPVALAWLLAPQAVRAESATAAVDVGSTEQVPAQASETVPPPLKLVYLQYGVAFTAQFATGGAFCVDVCILGSGGGIAGRVGWHSAGDWYFGGAYEMTKQDPTKLLTLAILQQLRFEARRYWLHGLDTQPMVSFGGGLAGYGNEWAISTWGPAAFFGVGVESQVKNGPVFGVTVAYRPMYLLQRLQPLNTESGFGPGFAHMIGLEVSLEARDPL